VARALFLLLIAAALLIDAAAAQAPGPAGAVLYEGARLITGGDGPPIERSAFLVQRGHFTRVGRQGGHEVDRAKLRGGWSPAY
jgi:hypothetical protein